MSAAPFRLLLLAAGSGKRMQGAVGDKVLAPLAGIPVVRRSLEAFVAAGGLEGAWVTYRDEAQRARLAAVLDGLPVLGWVQGGAERQDSVLAGLEVIGGDGWVAIHDAARPLVTPASIRKVLARATETGAAILASRSADTVKIARPGDTAIADSPDRALVWLAETPQVFRTDVILSAHRQAKAAGIRVTDDASAMAAVGKDVALVEGDAPNPKLTRASDLALAEALLATRRA